MNTGPDPEAAMPLLEVIYFSSGLKSRIYGSELRAEWLPPIDRIGLQNDIYLSPGQHVVDVSRLVGADGIRRVTWVGLYAHGKDLYGDRGNFCGVGAWLPDGLILDHQQLLQTLTALISLLDGATPPADAAEVDARMVDNCRRALSHLKSYVIGHAVPGSGQPFAGNYESEIRYVCFDEPWSPDSDLLRQLADTIDALMLADLKLKPGRLLFAFGRGLQFDTRTDPARRTQGFASLFGTTRLTRPIVRTQLATLAAVGARATAAAQQAETAERQLAELGVERGRLLQELAAAKAELERQTADYDQRLDSIETQERLSTKFWDRVEERLQRAIAGIRPPPAALPLAAAELRPVVTDPGGVGRRLGAIEDKLVRIELSLRQNGVRAENGSAPAARAGRDRQQQDDDDSGWLALLQDHALTVGLGLILALLLIFAIRLWWT